MTLQIVRCENCGAPFDTLAPRLWCRYCGVTSHDVDPPRPRPGGLQAPPRARDPGPLVSWALGLGAMTVPPRGMAFCAGRPQRLFKPRRLVLSGTLQGLALEAVRVANLEPWLPRLPLGELGLGVSGLFDCVLPDLPCVDVGLDLVVTLRSHADEARRVTTCVLGEASA